MSIESRTRPSHGWAIHERNRKARERREQQPLTTLPSWEITWGKIDLLTHNNQEQSDLVSKNRSVIKEAFDGLYDLAAGKGSKKRDRFMRRYTQNKKSKTYNPELIDSLSPYISLMRDSFPTLKSRR